MRKILLAILFFSYYAQAQKFEISNLNEVTKNELEMTFYEKDSSAYGLVLEERGQVYFTPKNDYYKYRKDYYVRIKVLTEAAKDVGDIKIYFWKSGKVTDIEGITHNLEKGEIIKSQLSEKDIYTTKYSKKRKLTTFSLPNVKVGSVIEYKFSMYSTDYSIYDWDFQSELPKIKSSYLAKLPLYPKYNIKRIGALKASSKSSILKRNCIGIKKCIEIKQEMKNIPAFIEEDYMLSKRNYISGLQYEYDYYNKYIKKGENHNWKSADKLVKDLFVFKLNEANLIRSKIPKDIISEQNDLTKAMRVHHFIKNFFTWNNYIGLFRGRTTKKAISEQKGSITDINMTLYNALKAVDLEPKIVLLSTRDERKLNKLFPALSEFNYLILFIEINGKEYFLDATDKLLPFGMIPFECLNGDGRVFDFKKNEHYWKDIKPSFSSSIKSAISCTLNEGLILNGTLDITRKGYEAFESRAVLETTKKEKYLEEFESENLDFEITSYKNSNLKELGKPFKETYNFDIDLDLTSNKKLIINPFLYGRLVTNPFKLKNRHYAVDYGYKRKYISTISITVPNGYKIKSIPEKLAINMPNKSASLIVNSFIKGNTINIYMKISINKEAYYKNEYQYLKEFYNKIIMAENSFIELVKD
ncbi:MAG: DUF3857 domain-containing protein [Flavobacteriaceae bacterium]